MRHIVSSSASTSGSVQRPDHALIIGIDAYWNEAREGVYGDLQGAVADAESMAAFVRALGATTVEVLTAPRDREPETRRPTYAGIVAAWDRLVESSAQGNQVLVYFAGHGGRVDSTTEGKSFDETLVPTDIATPEGRHLRDVEMLVLIERLLGRGVFLTLVIDACHAGGMVYRLGDETKRVRGRGAVDRTPRPDASLVADSSTLMATWRRHHRPMRELEVVSGWLPKPRGYVLLAACREDQEAQETLGSAGAAGVFTANLLSTLGWRSSRRQLATIARLDQSWRAVMRRVVDRVHQQTDGQTPVVEGERNRQCFGETALASNAAIRVISSCGRRVEIDFGRAQGARMEMAVRPYARSTNPAATWIVDRVAETSSWARRASPGSDGDISIAMGERVALVALPPDLRLRVRLEVPKADAAALRRALNRHAYAGWLDVDPQQDKASSDVVLWDGTDARTYDVVASSHALPPLARALPWPTREDVDGWGDALLHLARIFYVCRLGSAAKRPEREEGAAIAACVFPLPETWDRDRSPTAIHTAKAEVGEHTRASVPVDGWLCLEIRNVSSLPLNIAVLDLQPDLAINRLYPGTGGGPTALLAPDAFLQLPLRARLPSGYVEGTDRLEVLASPDPFDTSVVEVAALGASPHRGTSAAIPGGQGLESGLSIDADTLHVVDLDVFVHRPLNKAVGLGS